MSLDVKVTSTVVGPVITGLVMFDDEPIEFPLIVQLKIGPEPPLTAIAFRLSVEPEQTLLPEIDSMLTLGVTDVVIDIVIEFELTEFCVTQGSFVFIVTDTTSPSAKVEEENPLFANP